MPARPSVDAAPTLSRLVGVVRRNAGFRRLYAANAVSQVGDWLNVVALLSLLLVSLGFWWPIVKPSGCGRWCMGSWGKLGFILLATIPQTFAGLLFALAHRAFYADYADAARSIGVNPLTDQQLAGACMAVLSKLALFAAFSVVLWRMLEPGGADGDVDDDSGGGDGRDAPTPVRPGAPAWLRLLDGPRLREEPPVRGPVTAGRR